MVAFWEAKLNFVDLWKITVISAESEIGIPSSSSAPVWCIHFYVNDFT